MPSMTDDDDHPFDPLTTPCLGMGADRRHVLAAARSPPQRQPPRIRGGRADGRAHRCAAPGRHSARPGQPGWPGPLDLGGHVLLLGVGHDADTTVHLAEYMVGVRYRRPEIRHCACRDGVAISRYRATRRSTTAANASRSLTAGWTSVDLQRLGVVGHAGGATCKRAGCGGCRAGTSSRRRDGVSAPTRNGRGVRRGTGESEPVTTAGTLAATPS